jgi:hypothetical protein
MYVASLAMYKDMVVLSNRWDIVESICMKDSKNTLVWRDGEKPPLMKLLYAYESSYKRTFQISGHVTMAIWPLCGQST